MARFILDMWMDGYDTEEDMVGACLAFIDDELNFSASSAKARLVKPTDILDVCPECDDLFCLGVIICPECGVAEHGDAAETHIIDHGYCRECLREWQFQAEGEE
jgi:hypothetical protein